MSPPRLAVVIPAFDEALRLGSTLERVLDHLERRAEAFELLVVDERRERVVDTHYDDARARRVLAHDSIVRIETEQGPALDSGEPRRPGRPPMRRPRRFAGGRGLRWCAH